MEFGTINGETRRTLLDIHTLSTLSTRREKNIGYMIQISVPKSAQCVGGSLKGPLICVFSSIAGNACPPKNPNPGV